jgi:hypothetical protein
MYTFNFDGVLRDSDHQEDIFSRVTPLLEGTMEGVNASVLAYGGIGSGKTKTMLGYDLWNMAKGVSSNALPTTHGGRRLSVVGKASIIVPSISEVTGIMDSNPEDAGVIFRAMSWLFEKKARMTNTGVCDVDISVMYLEVINEDLNDLLRPKEKAATLYLNTAVPKSTSSPTKSVDSPRAPALDIKQAPDGEVLITGATELKVENEDDVRHVLYAGAKTRVANAKGAGMSVDEFSAKSNTVFVVNVKVVNLESHITRSSKIMFVDLAGAEAASAAASSKASNRNSNKSLVSLGFVVQSMYEQTMLDKKANRSSSPGKASSSANALPPPPASPSAKSPPSKRAPTPVYVPYRESKLTRLLSDCLGRHANSLFVCTVSPDSANFSNTLRTLQFGEKARRVVVEPLRKTAATTSLSLSLGGLVGDMASSGVAGNWGDSAVGAGGMMEIRRLKALTRYLYNCLLKKETGVYSNDAEAEFEIARVLDGGAGTDLEHEVQHLRTELLQVCNERTALVDQVSALRKELEAEREEKREICRIVYQEEVPQHHKYRTVEFHADDSEEVRHRKEHLYFILHGIHSEHHDSSSSKGGKGESKRRESTSSHNLAVVSIDDPESQELLVHSSRPALPHEHIDFGMQSKLLDIERAAVTKSIGYLAEWRKAEDVRWAFVTRQLASVREEVRGGEEVAGSAGEHTLEHKFSGLKDRLVLLEGSLQSHEVGMRLLNSTLVKQGSKTDLAGGAGGNPNLNPAATAGKSTRR